MAAPRLADYFAVLELDESQLQHGASVGVVKQQLPVREWEDVPFAHSIQMFCFPQGWNIRAEWREATYFVCILTNDMGSHQFACCLQTFEPCANPMVDHGDDQLHSSTTLYKPKVFVLLSRFPYFDLFRVCLNKIFHSIKTRSGQTEAMIATILGNVKLVGQSVTSFNLGNERFSVRPLTQRLVPLTGCRITDLVRNLGSLHNLLVLIRCILSDQKIIFHSSSLSRLSDASYALKCLIFPFEYTYTIVSVLPELLLEYLESPTPYVMGVLSRLIDKVSSTAAVIVDLDLGEVRVPPTVSLPSIPEPYLGRLTHRLQLVLNPELQTCDYALSPCLPPVPDNFVMDKQIRACFLLFFTELLYGYRTCLQMVRLHSQTTILFLKSAFIRMRRLSDPSFLNMLIDGQMFQLFIASRGIPYRECDVFDEVVCSVFDLEQQLTDEVAHQQIHKLSNILVSNEKQEQIMTTNVPRINGEDTKSPETTDSIDVVKFDQLLHQMDKERSPVKEENVKMIVPVTAFSLWDGAVASNKLEEGACQPTLQVDLLKACDGDHDFYQKFTGNPKIEWRLEENIGYGAYGVVTKARLRQNHEILAACRSVPVTEQGILDSFLTESSILKSAQHRNVVTLYDAFVYKSRLWYFHELVEGFSLKTLMRCIDRPLMEESIRYVTKQVVAGLEFLHDWNLVHGDLNASNVFLTTTALVKLMDNGSLAELKDVETARETTIRNGHWMAPEVALSADSEDHPYNWSSDIWSLGITIIEMAQMEPPNSMVSPKQVLIKVQTSDPPALDNPSAFSANFSHFLTKCLVKNPQGRAETQQLAMHPFIRDANDKKSVLALLAEVTAQVQEEVVVEDDRATVDKSLFGADHATEDMSSWSSPSPGPTIHETFLHAHPLVPSSEGQTKAAPTSPRTHSPVKVIDMASSTPAGVTDIQNDRTSVAHSQSDNELKLDTNNGYKDDKQEGVGRLRDRFESNGSQSRDISQVHQKDTPKIGEGLVKEKMRQVITEQATINSSLEQLKVAQEQTVDTHVKPIHPHPPRARITFRAIVEKIVVQSGSR